MFLSQLLSERKEKRKKAYRLYDLVNGKWDSLKEEITEEDSYNVDVNLRHELNENVDDKPSKPLR